MDNPEVLLINPPLWNVYSPHLAVPLLTGQLRRDGWRAKGIDLGIEAVDWLVSSTGLATLAPKIEGRLAGGPSDDRQEVARALVTLPSAVADVDHARQLLSSHGIISGEEDQWSEVRRTIRNALWCVSAAFPGLSFDLKANRQLYSTRSSADVLRAARDPEANVYRWVFEQQLPKHLYDPSIGIIGISVSADTQIIAALTLVDLIRKLRPDVHLTLGGNYITRLVAKSPLSPPFLDLVDDFIVFEGETALSRLCSKLFRGGVEDIPGLVQLDGRGFVRKNAPVEVDLTDSPLPIFDDVPLDRYFAPGPILPTFASRSCSWHCAFCSIPFASNKFRERPTQAVVDELEELSRRHDTSYFMFVDEILSQRTLRNLSHELLNRPTDLKWYGETRFSAAMSESLARDLHQSGCRRMNLGLESYNDRVLKRMNKAVSLNQVRRNIDAFLQAGIAIHLFTIAGFPGETVAEANRTVDFCREVMRRSEAAGINYSSWGPSPFTLDLLSPVGRHPEEFGITITSPSRREDLALSASYTTTEGMSEDEIRNFTEASPLERVARFHAGGVDIAAAEEFLFLQACHVISPRRHDNHLGDLYVVALQADTRVVLASDASIATYSDGPELPSVILLYSARSDAFFEIECAQTEQSHDLSVKLIGGAQVADLLQVAYGCRSGLPLDALVGQLVRFGVLRPSSADRSTVYRPMPGAPLFFLRDPSVVEMSCDEPDVIVHPATGASIHLGVIAKLIWSLCEDGLSLAELPQEGQDVIEACLASLAAAGMIYPVAGERQAANV